MKAHLKAAFGTVAIFREPNPSASDDLGSRGRLGITLYRDFDAKGSVIAYLFDQKVVASRATFRPVPMSADVMRRLPNWNWE
jgi:hypothetical protein